MLPTFYDGVTILEFQDKLIFAELLPTLQKYIVREINPTTIMVDHKRAEEIIKLLRKKGYEPKITDLSTGV